MTHEVVLQGYNVKPGSLQLGTFDSYGIEKIHVTADDEWAGLEILAVFHAPDAMWHTGWTRRTLIWTMAC